VNAIRRLLAPGLVLLIGGLIVGWAWQRAPQPPPRPIPAASVPLDEVSLVCPAPVSAGVPPSPIGLTVVSLPDSASPTGGRVDARTMPDGTTLQGLELTGESGHGHMTLPAAKSADVEITGQGPLAPGLSAFATTTAARQAGGGLALSGCSAATRSWWFVGAGATIDHASTVIVTNPDPTDAIASITLLGPDGPLETVGTEGLVIPPGKSVAVALSEVAAGQEDLAVHVAASQGRITAGVFGSWSTALGPNGSEWLPPAGPPVEEFSLAGVPAGGERTLVVANPGTRSARVAVSVSDADGTFQPDDVRTVSVAAGSVQAVELPEDLGRRVVTVRLSSSTPVSAALRARFGPASGDVAYAGRAEVLQGPTAAPVAAGAGALPAVALSSADPQQAAGAVIETYDDDGALVDAVDVEVAAGTTQLRTAPVPPAAGQRAAYVVVRPEQGRVQASAVYSGADGSSALVLTTPVRTALTPQVVGRE